MTKRIETTVAGWMDGPQGMDPIPTGGGFSLSVPPPVGFFVNSCVIATVCVMIPMNAVFVFRDFRRKRRF